MSAWVWYVACHSFLVSIYLAHHACSQHRDANEFAPSLSRIGIRRKRLSVSVGITWLDIQEINDASGRQMQRHGRPNKKAVSGRCED